MGSSKWMVYNGTSENGTVPPNGWFLRENPSINWMIWGYLYSRKPPNTDYTEVNTNKHVWWRKSEPHHDHMMTQQTKFRMICGNVPLAWKIPLKVTPTKTYRNMDESKPKESPGGHQLVAGSQWFFHPWPLRLWMCVADTRMEIEIYRNIISNVWTGTPVKTAIEPWFPAISMRKIICLHP